MTGGLPGGSNMQVSPHGRYGMARYLVVAHQTASSRALLDALTQISHRDAKAAFTLLVPVTTAPHGLTWTEGERIDAARRAGDAAQQHMQRSGLNVDRVAVGDASPVEAIADLLRDHGAIYREIVVSTLPPGRSRWLHMDVISRVERGFGLPVTAVVTTEAVAV